MESPGTVRYAGFWIRFLAMWIDCILISAVTYPLLFAVYGKAILTSTSLVHGPMELLISDILPVIALFIFWKYRSATPGKMIFGMKIVDERTGGSLSMKQCVVRFFAYLVSMLPFGYGFLAIAFDPKKRAWHDRLAGTVVVR